jgi:fatty-acyl-CoA synthase
VERVLRRHPAVAEAAVFGVPDPVAGDQIMACLVLRDGAALAPAELAAFLAAQADLGPRQHPRFVRLARQMPRTPTFKVLTRMLAAERWNTADPVWWRPPRRPGPGGPGLDYVLLEADQATALDAELGPSPGS